MILEKVSEYYKKQNLNTSSILQELHQYSDTFFSTEKCIEMLKNDYKKWGRIIVAYDFDDTIKPSDQKYNCDNVVKLLQLCSKFNDFEMICFTARTKNSDIDEVKNTLNKLNIRYDSINEDCYRIQKQTDYEHTSKVYFNIFLDNRAGLESAYKILLGFVEWYLEQPSLSE